MTPSAILPQHIDSTMLTCARSCLEKFRLEFIFGLRPPGISIDLHAGACLATAFEVYRKNLFGQNLNHAEALEIAHAAFMVAWGDFEIPEFKKTAKTRDNCWLAVEKYFERFPGHTDHIQPFFFENKPTFEFTFAIPLEPASEPGQDDERGFPLHPSGEPFIYTGRFDMLGKYQSRPCVTDDKSTGRSISTGWADQWNIRNQFLGYVWACQQSGIDLNTVVIRGISILKTKIDFAEAIKQYSDYLIKTWHEQLRRDLWRIRRAWDEGYFDLNMADACTAYGNCIFMDVCCSPNKDSWMNQFAVHRWNPLNKNPVGEAGEKAP